MERVTCTKTLTMFYHYIEGHSDLDLYYTDPKVSRHQEHAMRYVYMKLLYCKPRHVKVMNENGNLYKKVNHVLCLNRSPQ